MEDLMAYIRAKNEETMAWLQAAPGRGAGLIVEDPDFWKKQGITTVAEFYRSNLLCGFSDAYKELYGFRPRVSMADWDIADIEKEYGGVCQALLQEAEKEDTKKADVHLAVNQQPFSDNPFAELLT